jgi:hypothetical protein
MTFPGRGPHDTSSIDAVGQAKREEMRRAAARGERNVRHGANLHRSPLWERLLAWVLIVAFIVFIGWFAIFGYKALLGDSDGGQDEPDTAGQIDR